MDKNLANTLALKILEEKRADVYYQATAFDVLYKNSHDELLLYIFKNVISVDVYLFKEMLSQVTCDAGTLTDREKVLEVMKILRNALLLRNQDELKCISKEVDLFKEAMISMNYGAIQ